MNRVAFGTSKESVSPMAADLQQLLASALLTAQPPAVDLVDAQLKPAFERIVAMEKPFADFLDEVQQAAVTEQNRAAVLAAMQDVCRRLKLTPQTFSLAAHYFDMFLSAVK
jgi:hypothetical protein